MILHKQGHGTCVSHSCMWESVWLNLCRGHVFMEVFRGVQKEESQSSGSSTWLFSGQIQ